VRSSSIRLSPSPLIIPLLNEQTRVKTKAKHPAGVTFQPPTQLLSLDQLSSGRSGRPAGRSSRPWNRRPASRAGHGAHQSRLARDRPFPPDAESIKPRLGRGRRHPIFLGFSFRCFLLRFFPLPGHSTRAGVSLVYPRCGDSSAMGRREAVAESRNRSPDSDAAMAFFFFD
jgi:hypothetical protein